MGNAQSSVLLDQEIAALKNKIASLEKKADQNQQDQERRLEDEKKASFASGKKKLMQIRTMSFST